MKNFKLSDYITLKSAGLIVGGSLLFSAAMNLLIVPMGLYSGGFLGIAQLFRQFLLAIGLHVENIDVAGIVYFLLNVPLFLLSFKSIGKPFFVKTVLAVACYTVFLTVIVSPETPIISDKLTCCLIGGVLAGTGAGMTLLAGGSGGGEEILGVYLSQKNPNFSVGKLSILINIFVYGCCLIFFNIGTVVYSLIYSVVTNLSLDKIHFQNIMMNIIIISKKEGVQQLIYDTTRRGSTHWDGYGGYADDHTNILLTIVSKRESIALRRALKDYDPDAFVIVNEDIDVVGNFEMRIL